MTARGGGLARHQTASARNLQGERARGPVSHLGRHAGRGERLRLRRSGFAHGTALSDDTASLATPPTPSLEIASLSLFIPLAVRLRPSEILKQPVRRRVYEEVLAHPGIHFRGLMRLLGIGNGDLAHHLIVLQGAGLVHSAHVAGQRMLFPAGTTPLPGVPFLTPREAEVLDLVASRAGASVGRLASEIGLSRQCTAYHAHRLESRGFLRMEGAGRTHLCSLADELDTLNRVPIKV